MITQEELEKKRSVQARKAELEKLEPASFGEYEKIFNKWLLMPDAGILKLIPAVIVANRLPRKAIWIFIKGPSGGGKSAILDAFSELEEVFPISTLTPNTLLSGMMNKEASLLPRLNNKNLLFKDFTNLLSQSKEARNEIMGQLRDAYDGHLVRPVGTGRILEWGPGGKIGVMAATTQAVDMILKVHATLGERFIHYLVITPDRKTVAQKCLENNECQAEMDKELKDAAFAFMKGVEMPQKIEEIPDEYRQELIKIANFTALARSGIFREEYGGRKEILFVPASEMPTRIILQLDTLAAGLIIINGNVFVSEDMNIVYKCALDSIPSTNRVVLTEMAKKDNLSTKDIAMILDYPTSTVRMYLENLALHKVCSRKKGSETEEGGTSDRWTMNPEFAEIILKFEGTKKEAPAELTAREEDLKAFEKQPFG